MNTNNNRSDSFKKHQAPSLSRQLSLPASTITSNTSAGVNSRELENALNTSSLLEDPEPEALTIDASNYDEGKNYQMLNKRLYIRDFELLNQFLIYYITSQFRDSITTSTSKYIALEKSVRMALVHLLCLGLHRFLLKKVDLQMIVV